MVQSLVWSLLALKEEVVVPCSSSNTSWGSASSGGIRQSVLTATSSMKTLNAIIRLRGLSQADAELLIFRDLYHSSPERLRGPLLCSRSLSVSANTLSWAHGMATFLGSARVRAVKEVVRLVSKGV